MAVLIGSAAAARAGVPRPVTGPSGGVGEQDGHFTHGMDDDCSGTVAEVLGPGFVDVLAAEPAAPEVVPVAGFPVDVFPVDVFPVGVAGVAGAGGAAGVPDSSCAVTART